MKAQEAHDLAKENHYNDIDLSLEEVFNAILNRSKEGGFSINWYGEINYQMKDRLEDFGYKVIEVIHLGEVYNEISWEEIN